MIGAACLVGLFLYESYRPLKEPLVHMHLFKIGGWVAVVISLALGASVYYPQAIVCPRMTAKTAL